MTFHSDETPPRSSPCCPPDSSDREKIAAGGSSECASAATGSTIEIDTSTAAIDEATVSSKIFAVQGLDCHEEVDLLRGTVGKLRGVQRLTFDVFHGKMSVAFDTTSVDESQIIAAIAQAGLRGESVDQDSSQIQPIPPSSTRRWWIPSVAGVWIVIGFVSHWLTSGEFLTAVHGEVALKSIFVPTMLSYGIAIAVGGIIVFPRAWISLRSRRADMHVLMSAAVIGAVALGLWLEGAMVMWLFTIAMALEAMIVARARRAITSLLRLAPESATCRKSPQDEWQSTPVESIEPGTKVRIAPGERVPIDGIIEAGESTAEESMLTGEAIPVEKRIGDKVLAGSINGMGEIEIEATCRATESTLARIVRMVEQAQSEHSPTEQFVERFANIYTPITMTLSLLTAIIPPLFLGESWGVWIEHALVLLVVACPCALVIATPVAMVASIAASARQGILIKGARHLETMGRLDAIAFDKTGTLTKGHLRVARIAPREGIQRDDFLLTAASLAARNQHPISQAILSEAQTQLNVGELLSVEDPTVIAGKGTSGIIQGHSVWLGNRALLEEIHPQSGGSENREERTSDRPEGSSGESAGQTIVWLFDRDKVWGQLHLSDEIRSTAPDALARIRKLDVEHLVMLTGDRDEVGRRVAEQLNIDEVHTESLPDDKLEHIHRLRAQYGTTAMVGDGINDGPALAAADVSVALGRKGTDVASETADIVLMNDRFEALPGVIARGKRTLRIIAQNVAFALVIKLVVVVLAWLGWGTIWMAVAADSGTSILVVLNALRLLREPSGR